MTPTIKIFTDTTIRITNSFITAGISFRVAASFPVMTRSKIPDTTSLAQIGVIALDKLGKTVRDIAKEVHISYKDTRDLVRKYNGTKITEGMR